MLLPAGHCLESRLPSMRTKEYVVNLLLKAGIRPTDQRIALASLLYVDRDRHTCAASLFEEAQATNLKISAATVYSIFNQLHSAGLLRLVAVEDTRNSYDTNVSSHFHFYLEESATLIDIDSSALEIAGLPDPPQGREIEKIDVVIRLRRKAISEAVELSSVVQNS